MQWFENEEFWRELYPYMFPAERFAATPDPVTQLLALTGITAGRVLDLCCGPGRHSVELARRGFAVTGVDLTPFLLDRARERAAEAAVTVEWVQEDMRRFRRPEAFDLACSMFTSWGYFDDDDNVQVLRNVRESLAPGGIFIVETLGKERLARIWKDSICTDYPDGAVVVQRPRIRDNWCRVDNEWTIAKDGRALTFHFDHGLYSGRELRDRLLAVGFQKVDLYGGLDGSDFGLDAMRLVAVAR
jgi:SAM-dependent methyltransferase